MMKENFYTVLIEAVKNEEAFVKVFWVFAQHIGEAIGIVEAYLNTLDLVKFRIEEVDPADRNDLPTDVIELEHNKLYCTEAGYSYPIEEYPDFNLPSGVVLSSEEGDYEYEALTEGYLVYEDEDQIQHLEIVVDQSRLFDLYFDIGELLKSIRVFWLRLADDWEVDGTLEIYANESLNDLVRIKQFVMDNYEDIFRSGFLTATIYSEEGATNLNLDEHKIIHILTQSKDLVAEIKDFLDKSNFQHFDAENFVSVEYGFHHWHYRPIQSKDRAELIELLLKNGFFLWKRE
ncbi:MAG TPA: hypothetical protein PL158_12945 [Bacillota bacterium]|mgnify:CR=1 FL=1|jgi:uncharacterized protein YbaR (Trm112 family)|nr:hypothetical protein [Bacillota bacterium]HOL09945.1 hypothetical protein [Bacillota bacterium]